VKIPLLANLLARARDVTRSEFVGGRSIRERRVGDAEVGIDSPPEIGRLDLREMRSQIGDSVEVPSLSR
jgi:hypothetical protein